SHQFLEFRAAPAQKSSSLGRWKRPTVPLFPIEDVPRLPIAPSSIVQRLNSSSSSSHQVPITSTA
ncbi:MAG: hypothetical protein VKL01_11195, partial [Limnothrix sp.]|nr:hypothetical protein [Limnothrix sp.]